MSSQQYSPLVNHVLSHVTLDRLQKAVDGLSHNTYTITLITNTDSDISGLVKNGDGAEYGVVLTHDRVFCSCKDSLYRHPAICKHAAAMALSALRQPAEQPVEQPQPQQPISHLMRLNARAVVCHERYPERIMYWPWPETIVNNQTQWPEITICPDCVRERNHHVRSERERNEITVCPDCIRNRYPLGIDNERAPDLRLGKVRPTFDAAA